jgi:hypothetical protein
MKKEFKHLIDYWGPFLMPIILDDFGLTAKLLWLGLIYSSR